MTTVVMVQMEDDVIAGWDSLMGSGNNAYELTSPKVWEHGGLVYGFSGYLRITDIIESLEFPQYDGSDPRLWIIKNWVPVFKEAIVEDPFVYDREEGTIKGFNVLMVVGGQVFDIDSSVSPTQTADGLYAIGSGAHEARGVLVAGGTVMEALSVAKLCDVYTGGDLTAKSVKSILDEAYDDDPVYRVTIERANQPHKKWGFLVDYDEITRPRDFEKGIGAMLYATLTMDREFLESKHGPKIDTSTGDGEGEAEGGCDGTDVPDARRLFGVGGPIHVPEHGFGSRD